ncbi:MAG: universal stress protein [Candidatus Eremiobacterota bacterium]
MIKSILVPMGTSDSSVAALKTSINLSNLFKAELRLLYVEDLRKINVTMMNYMSAGVGISFDSPALELENKRAEENIKKEIEFIETLYNDCKNTIESKNSLTFTKGDITEEILKETHSVDLLVMGKSLEKDTEGKLQGYVFNVIQRTNKPIISVSKGETLGDNFLIAYDRSTAANNALRITGEFIPLLNPAITVITVKEDREEAKSLIEEAKKYLLPYKEDIKTIWKHGKEVETIVEIVKEKQISCVVMGGYGDNKIREFFLGRTTEQVLNMLDIPVIVANV